MANPWAQDLRQLAGLFADNHEVCKFMNDDQHDEVAKILRREADRIDGDVPETLELRAADGSVITNSDLSNAIEFTSERIRRVGPTETQHALLTDHLASLLAIQAHRAGIK